jgi:hypothetical protein
LVSRLVVLVRVDVKALQRQREVAAREAQDALLRRGPRD